jgi:protein gp37
MAKNSKIEWTHHTFNPWWGCTKISPACQNCYAETWAVRVGVRVWGSKAPRRFFGEAHWAEPLQWNREAEQEGERRRVFCASMADVFENRRELGPWREKLWTLIEHTQWLDWLLLTKRPNLVARYVPWRGIWPRNVWLGTTVESQKWADLRIPVLIQYPAVVRFISCEPLLGPLNLRPWLKSLNWVIAGGESGLRARPMIPAWVRNIRDQCVQVGVPFHFKQWGHWRPEHALIRYEHGHRSIRLDDTLGNTFFMVALGKKAAGRDLDGRVWNELPDLSV